MNAIRQFFFAEESPRRLALVRICLGLVLFCDAAMHWPYAVELYSTFGPALPVFIRQEPLPAGDAAPPSTTSPQFTGPVTSAVVTFGQTVDPQNLVTAPARRIVTVLHPPIPGPTLAVALATLQLFVLFAMTVGWRTRTSLWLTFTLTLSLGLLDGSTTFAKYSVLALHFLLLLALSSSHRVWSLDSLRSPVEATVTAPAWTRRLMQLQLCHIYLGSALTKLQNPTFLSGDLLQFSLLDHDWGGRWLGLWLATQPHAVVVASLCALLIELLFPFLVWVPAMRIPMLCAAALLHLGVWLTLNVSIFSPVMFSCLIVFLSDKDLDRLSPPARRLTKGLVNDLRLLFLQKKAEIAAGTVGATTAVGNRLIRVTSYVMTAGLIVGLGLGWQMFEDPYGAFGRREMPGLKRLSREDVDPMLAKRLPPHGHYIHQIRLGNRVSGHQAFGDDRQFRRGQRVYVVVQLNQHPVLKLEGLLIDPTGSEVARYTHTVQPNFSHAIDGFELTASLTPGSYTLILQADGFQVGQKNFELVP